MKRPNKKKIIVRFCFVLVVCMVSPLFHLHPKVSTTSTAVRTRHQYDKSHVECKAKIKKKM